MKRQAMSVRAPARIIGNIFLLGLVAAGASACSSGFDQIRRRVMIHSGEYKVLEGAQGGRVLITPGLQGRILTSEVGSVDSVGWVFLGDIEKGDRDIAFNNHGGQDRLWIGPEAGSYGIYFKPGDPMTRNTWQVPPDLNKGEMKMESPSDNGQSLSLTREMEFTNYIGTKFSIRVQRQIALVPPAKLNEELGMPLPDGVNYIGSYSLNTMTNTGESAWKKDTGLLNIWILGQFIAGPNAVIMAPFHAGDASELGPEFNDDYFGRPSVDTPERFTTKGNVVLFRADGRKEGKFGLRPRRTTGLAGAYDPDRSLLVIVKFDVHPDDPFHANFAWVDKDPTPYVGDVFQSYNAGGVPGAPDSFYELESVSPCRELKPNERIVHRHATFSFHGERAKLDLIAKRVLGISLDQAVGTLSTSQPPRQ